MSNKVIYILMFVMLVLGAVIPFFYYVLIGLGIYWYVKNKETIKENKAKKKALKTEKKKQKENERMQKFLQTEEGQKYLAKLDTIEEKLDEIDSDLDQ